MKDEQSYVQSRCIPRPCEVPLAESLTVRK